MYVYGVAPSGAAVSTRGIGDAPVSVVEHGELAAIVSRVDAKVRAKRRDLLRHSDVLQTAFAGGPVIPLRFGTVFASEGAVVDELLASRYEELVALLQQLETLAELRVRATFDEQALLAEVVRDDRRVAALRAGGASQMELGEAVAHAVAARREAGAGAIVQALGAAALDVRVDEPREEWEVVRASFLVERSRVKTVEREAAAVAEREGRRMTIELIGPMPPHSFVSLEGGA
ncbi:MAG TPA: GvpL/GvpF family gas vesicle protein [Gaiellaceae bacterium]